MIANVIRVTLTVAVVATSVSHLSASLRIAQVFGSSTYDNLHVGGTQRGGRRVEVTGYGFKPGMTVRLGDRYVANLTQPPRAEGQAAVGVNPSNESGWVDVTITNPDGESATLERGFLFTPVGDTNGDGEVGAIDLVKLVRTLAVNPEHDTGNGDVDGNGRLDTGDLAHLVNYLFAEGSPPVFEPPIVEVLTASPQVVHMGGSSVVTFALAGAESWSVASSLGNSIHPNEGIGAINTTSYTRDKADGSDVVVLTARGRGGLTTHPVIVRCPGVDILYLQASPGALRVGQVATVSGNVVDVTSWFLTSALRNPFDLTTGSTSGEFSRTYTAVTAGVDTVTLTAKGHCGPVTSQVSIVVEP